MTKKATLDDFDFFYRLYMAPETNPFLLYEWMPKPDFEPVFEDLVGQGVLYIFESEGVPVGMFKLIRLQHRTSHIAYLGGLAIAPEQIGKGFGGAMMQAILDLGRELGLLRMELSTATSNVPAIRLYEKSGFVQEGVLRRYTHLQSEGRFLDEVMMSYLYEY
jgi:L-phenylalanine/L-methionine N-acetyltransferase